MAEISFSSIQKIRESAENRRQRLRSRTRPVVAWFCTYTPVEILSAAGLDSFRLIPEPGGAMMLADGYIDRSFCPYVRVCLGEALQGNHDYLDGVVIVNSCDAMRRLYDAWRYYVGGDFIELLDLPRVNSPQAKEYFRDCLAKFIGKLEAGFKVTVTDDAIRRAIGQHNQTRHLLKELYRLNNEKGMPLTGYQLQEIFRDANVLEAESLNVMLESLLGEVAGAGADVAPDTPRLLISGSLMDNLSLVRMVEESGARVVSDDMCTGTRHFWHTVETEGDPLVSLSSYHLERTPCPRMQDARKRFDHIVRLIADYKVDGVILYALKFCDNFLYDIPLLRKEMESRGIPVLVLEGDYTPGAPGRVKTRVEAFVEMLRKYVPAG